MNGAVSYAPIEFRLAAIRFRRGLLLLLAALLWMFAAHPVHAGPNVPPDTPAMSPDYLIGPGDTLQIFVWKNPELSGEVPVRPDGRITSPLVADIQAEGRRPTELAAELQKALAEYIQSPVVTVVVKAFAATDNTAAVRVFGSVVTPKTVPYRAGLTALDAVLDAGGLAIEANGNGAKLLRMEKDGYKAYPLRLKSLLQSGDAGANVKLLPGDIIQVPKSWLY